MRVLCFGVHRDVSVFGGNGKEFSANTNVNHLKSAVVDIVLG